MLWSDDLQTFLRQMFPPRWVYRPPNEREEPEDKQSSWVPTISGEQPPF